MTYSRQAAGALILSMVMGGSALAPPLQAASTRRARTSPRAAKPAASLVRFVPGVLELGPGEETLLEVRLYNPSGRPTIGTFGLNSMPGLTLSSGQWDGQLPPWGAKIYVRAKASENAEPGRYTLRARYFVDRAGEFRAVLPVRIKIPLAIEVIPDYRGSAVRVRAKNLLETRTERGKVELRSPDRFLENEVSAIFPPIPPGETREVSIPVVRGGIAGGERYRFDVSVTTWAGYKTSFSRYLKFYDTPM